MNKCCNCKHWRNGRTCRVTYIENGHICYDIDARQDSVTTGNDYGCTHWEPQPTPFHLESTRDVCAAFHRMYASDWEWSVVYEDGTVIGYYGKNEREAIEVCERLNRLWNNGR